MATDKVTVWRDIFLRDDRKERYRQLDWMGVPYMHDHVSKLLSSKGVSEGGGWAEYSRETHLKPLLSRLNSKQNSAQSGLDFISLGCGDGHIERHILMNGWPIRKMVALEYDSALLAAAEQAITPLGRCQSEFHQFDFNSAKDQNFGKFDVVFFCHSLHHCNDIEGLLSFVNRSMRDDGIVLGLDYFGPPRLQVEYIPLQLLEEIFSILPDHLRINLELDDLPVENRLNIKTISQQKTHDPTEAPRSMDARSLLFSTFPVIEVRPLGGTLLRPLFSGRAGNFRDESDIAIAQLLQFFERVLIENRVLQSDDLYFVLGKSNRI